MGELGQMEQDIVRLKGEGHLLSDPTKWDGPSAIAFRNDVWPPQVKRLDRIMEELRELQRSVAAVTGDILEAGGAHVGGGAGAKRFS